MRLDTSPVQLQRVSQEKAQLAIDVTTTPTAPGVQETPHLRRVLGQWDLVLLFVVPIVNGGARALNLGGSHVEQRENSSSNLSKLH